MKWLREHPPTFTLQCYSVLLSTLIHLHKLFHLCSSDVPTRDKYQHLIGRKNILTDSQASNTSHFLMLTDLTLVNLEQTLPVGGARTCYFYSQSWSFRGKKVHVLFRAFRTSEIGKTMLNGVLVIAEFFVMYFRTYLEGNFEMCEKPLQMLCQSYTLNQIAHSLYIFTLWLPVGEVPPVIAT